MSDTHEPAGKLLALLREARPSVAKHLHRHERALASALRRERPHLVELESQRSEKLRDLLSRIDEVAPPCPRCGGSRLDEDGGPCPACAGPYAMRGY